MESREQRIATLAATLKASGIAKSEAQAKMMAEDMIGVEEHVQKSYEVKHAEAHEYLQTAKNLGNPRQRKVEQPEVANEVSTAAKTVVKPQGSRLVEPIPTKNIDSSRNVAPVKNVESSSPIKKSDLPPAHTDIRFVGKTLNQAFDHDASHNTHNAALEAIKAQVSAESLSAQSLITSADDDLEEYAEDLKPSVNDAVADTFVEDISDDTFVSAASVTSFDASVDSVSVETTMPKEVIVKNVDDILKDVDDMIEAPDAPITPLGVSSESIPSEAISSETVDSDPIDNVGKSVDEVIGDASVESDQVESVDSSGVTEVTDSEESVEEISESPKLDAQKLVELMEEDGKLEEHTREIKEKPTNVKPKEDYEENNIDLSSMFDFNKGSIRK